MNQSVNETRIMQVLRDNPAYREIYTVVLDFCRFERKEEDVISFCETQRVNKTQIQSAASIVSLLINREALTRTLFVDGVVYEGSFEDFQADEDLPCDVESQIILQTTEEGLAAATHLQNELSFENLTSSCPQRIPAFKAVLALCAEPQGQTTQEIQETLKQKNMLDTDGERGIDSLHASYFTGALEHIGALIWKEKAWSTSEKGKSILAL